MVRKEKGKDEAINRWLRGPIRETTIRAKIGVCETKYCLHRRHEEIRGVLTPQWTGRRSKTGEASRGTSANSRRPWQKWQTLACWTKENTQDIHNYLIEHSNNLWEQNQTNTGWIKSSELFIYELIASAAAWLLQPTKKDWSASAPRKLVIQFLLSASLNEKRTSENLLELGQERQHFRIEEFITQIHVKHLDTNFSIFFNSL